ncbi:hypothetical protein OZ411_01190 [Bradyrhizobium sp. Arg237L]|uniref:hypothetical protein n=1 Tax=Bradyrhizobium sp. Arg237L TaxID=3003352 RepID=UPI00249F39E8|nr:hypothetical protein [Bradyrhizobium sp. Arg237L]MDI4231427.1 hypothetical protein [Bradyrhizobium sp. Arg237L]
MSSLKAFLPKLSEIIGISADALYSRQRALVQLGVLNAKPGRGPGSGAPLEAHNLAALLLALLCADSLQETDDKVRLLCEARPTDVKKCRLTGATTLQEAVAMLLTNPELLKKIDGISVHQGPLFPQHSLPHLNWYAAIYYARGTMVSSFEAKQQRADLLPAVRIQLSTDHATLTRIAHAFAEETAQ